MIFNEFEIDWYQLNVPNPHSSFASAKARILYEKELMVLRFFGETIEYREKFEGVVRLKLTTEEQEVNGTLIISDLDTKNDAFTYRLNGRFLDDSWQDFEGQWEDNQRLYNVTISYVGADNHLKIEYPPLESSQLPSAIEPIITDTQIKLLEVNLNDDKEIFDEEIKPVVSNNINAIPRINIESSADGRFIRHRATRSDARVRSIQRKMELHFGLPEGSVKLCKPDRSIIHPSAKIRTLRGFWEDRDY